MSMLCLRPRGFPARFSEAENNIETMRALLAFRADVNLRTGQGTAIVAAGRHCQVRAMKVLLAAGANASFDDCAESPLVEVISKHAKYTDSCQQSSEGIQGIEQGKNRTILWDVLALLRKMRHGAAAPDCRGQDLGVVGKSVEELSRKVMAACPSPAHVGHIPQASPWKKP